MIRSLSETVVLPIAGIVLTFVMCYELIQLIIERNNLHDIDTWIFFKWIFKTFVAVLILSNTWNIVMAVFDLAQHVVAQSAGLVGSDTAITADMLASLRATLEGMDVGPLLGLWLQSMFIGISHNPYELMAYLTAVFDDFTFAGVEAHLRQLFNEQYTLTFTEEIEVRYRTETRTDSEGNDYEVEVPYNWYILNVSLTAQSFTGIVTPRMDAEQIERYNVYMILKGNRQYLQSPFGETNWLPYVSSYYGYRVHPITGAKDYHKAVDIAMPEGTDILAGQDGTVTTAAWDNSYGWYVVLDDGEGLVSKYAHCSALLVSAGQTVQAGDVIARVGNTGTSTGAHLHLEIIKDGQYLNPLYFAVTNDFGQGPEYGDPGAAMGDGSYAAMIAEAEKYLGYPYVWGGSSPSTSFDCSGYVSWVINQSGVGSVGRKTAQGLYNLCTPVSAADAQPGDLIFFTGTYSTPSACSHVGIYVGGGQMIHCASAGVSYASINTSYW